MKSFIFVISFFLVPVLSFAAPVTPPGYMKLMCKGVGNGGFAFTIDSNPVDVMGADGRVVKINSISKMTFRFFFTRAKVSISPTGVGLNDGECGIESGLLPAPPANYTTFLKFETAAPAQFSFGNTFYSTNAGSDTIPQATDGFSNRTSMHGLVGVFVKATTGNVSYEAYPKMAPFKLP